MMVLVRVWICLAALLGLATAAAAVDIEIVGGGDDRLERQRAYARRELPLPGTPDLTRLKERLDAAGVKIGDAVFMRIFKAESELELWMRKGDQFVLFAKYPICQWSGVLGPKFYEGDNQSPEGFYTVARQQMNWRSRHRRAFNLNYPNPLDRALGRNGSHILVHGGCSTEGCFAMTNDVIDEIFRLAIAAFDSGQKLFHVQVLPFRMDVMSLMKQSRSPWFPFWLNLKTGHDLFEDTRLPPVVRACRNRYAFEQAETPSNGEPIEQVDCDPSVSDADGSTLRFAEQESRIEIEAARFKALATQRLAQKATRLAARPMSLLAAARARTNLQASPLTADSTAPQSTAAVATATKAPECNINLASCRKFVALKAHSELAATRQASSRRTAKTRIASAARPR